jgi:hypothetical protein
MDTRELAQVICSMDRDTMDDLVYRLLQTSRTKAIDLMAKIDEQDEEQAMYEVTMQQHFATLNP